MCNKSFGCITQVEPYLSLVGGQYVPKTKQPTEVIPNDCKDMLKYILSIPNNIIIGIILFNRGCTSHWSTCQ